MLSCHIQPVIYRYTVNGTELTQTDELSAGSMTHTITEQRDTLGRSTGYVYAKNDIPQQQTSIGYGTDGRVATAGFTHHGEHKEFLYSYLPGTHLLHTLTHPNGLTLTQSYDATRDLPTNMSYSRADALVVQRAYTYDILGRPTARDLARYGTQTSDTFGYNTRSELTTAHVNSADYSYAYDAIGNRTAATEDGTRTAYTASKLNQYTAEGSFRPTFDADGNQTLIKTSTGTWNVTYNAKNRPVLFARSDGSVTVECTYDTMGRRATKKVTTNGTLTEHRRFLYRGYLQIACCDLTRAYTPALWYITWDPTQETATRPLAIQKNGTWYTYGWDLTKNICETYRTDARIDLAYTYTPYGEVSPAHAYDQPLRWSSEYHDAELGLVYYNYRHYNPAMGRCPSRDLLGEHANINVYSFVQNSPFSSIDYLGNDFLGIESIPEILEHNNLITGARFLRHWINSSGTNIYDEDLNELLKYGRVKEGYDKLIKESTNEVAAKYIRKRAKEKNSKLRLYESIITPEVVRQEQVQYQKVASSPCDPVDDFYSAYGNATLYSIVDGYFCNKRKTLMIDSVHVILHDVFSFIDSGIEEYLFSQPLGFFDTTQLYVGKNPFKGKLVKNKHFIEYRNKTGKGSDFEIFTKVVETRLDTPIELHI